jgi:hypothetical protein
MRIRQFARVVTVALGLPFVMASAANSAPLAPPQPTIGQSDNIVYVAVRCGPHAHYLRGHRVKRDGRTIFIKGGCVRNH